MLRIFISKFEIKTSHEKKRSHLARRDHFFKFFMRRDETRRDEIAKIKFPQMRSFFVKRHYRYSYSEENRLKLLN